MKYMTGYIYKTILKLIPENPTRNVSRTQSFKEHNVHSFFVSLTQVMDKYIFVLRHMNYECHQGIDSPKAEHNSGLEKG